MIEPKVDEHQLERLAEVSVKIGLNLQKDQDLVLTAPVEALPLARKVAAAAYRAGAGLVTPILSDGRLIVERYNHGNDSSFDRAPGWLYDGIAKAFEDGAARMAIVGEDPQLLSNQNIENVARASKAQSLAYKPALSKITNFDINWTISAYPGSAWARQVFPDLSEEDAISSLAKAIFSASRVNGDDVVSDWIEHNKALHSRTTWLNQRKFSALHFLGPNVDLMVGLADQHQWHGGASEAKNGTVCNPNIPTEEVFTTPHSRKVDGRVRATKPLSHHGSLIEGIEVYFENGRIVNSTADKGEAVLKELLQTDEGASRLGEVALVPHSSPISQSGITFYNTLFDENASCHIAFGQCYHECFVDSANLDEVEVSRRGGNQSMIHVDWMIGGPHLSVDGIMKNGQKIPVFRSGEWAF